MERVSGTAFIDHYPQLNSLHMLNHRSFTISRSTVHNMLRATASYSSASLKTWRSSIQCPQLRLPAVQGTDKNYSRKNTYGKTGDGIRVSCIIWLRRYFFATASPPPPPPSSTLSDLRKKRDGCMWYNGASSLCTPFVLSNLSVKTV